MTRSRRLANRVFFYALIAIAVAVVVFPLIWMLGTARQAQRADPRPAGVALAQPVRVGQHRKGLELGPLRALVPEQRDLRCFRHARPDLHGHDGRLRLRHVRLPRKTGPFLHSAVRLDGPLYDRHCARGPDTGDVPLAQHLPGAHHAQYCLCPGDVPVPPVLLRCSARARRSGPHRRRLGVAHLLQGLRPPWPGPSSPPWGSSPS